MKRGEIVIVDIRPVNPAAKVRPALIVQNDRDNIRMNNTVLVQITSNIARAHEDMQYLIDASHPDFPGLAHPSVVNCSNLYTVEQQHVKKVIGSLSSATMNEIKGCLKKVFDL